MRVILLRSLAFLQFSSNLPDQPVESIDPIGGSSPARWYLRFALSLREIEELMADGTADIMFKPFHMNELRARLALAERRRTLIAKLNADKAALHAMSKEMIMGLQEELEEKQRRAAAAGGAQETPQ